MSRDTEDKPLRAEPPPIRTRADFRHALMRWDWSHGMAQDPIQWYMGNREAWRIEEARMRLKCPYTLDELRLWVSADGAGPFEMGSRFGRRKWVQIRDWLQGRDEPGNLV